MSKDGPLFTKPFCGLESLEDRLERFANPKPQLEMLMCLLADALRGFNPKRHTDSTLKFFFKGITFYIRFRERNDADSRYIAAFGTRKQQCLYESECLDDLLNKIAAYLA